MWPICGDKDRMTTYYYCAYEKECNNTIGAQARYRKRVDHGYVCEDKAITCPC